MQDPYLNFDLKKRSFNNTLANSQRDSLERSPLQGLNVELYGGDQCFANALLTCKDH